MELYFLDIQYSTAKKLILTLFQYDISFVTILKKSNYFIHSGVILISPIENIFDKDLILIRCLLT